MKILLWISGRTLRSEGFFYSWVPTKVCKTHKGETTNLGILKDGEHGLFWGHRDYENKKQEEIIICRETKKYNDESELLHEVLDTHPFSTSAVGHENTDGDYFPKAAQKHYLCIN